MTFKNPFCAPIYRLSHICPGIGRVRLSGTGQVAAGVIPIRTRSVTSADGNVFQLGGAGGFTGKKNSGEKDIRLAAADFIFLDPITRKRVKWARKRKKGKNASDDSKTAFIFACRRPISGRGMVGVGVKLSM